MKTKKELSCDNICRICLENKTNLQSIYKPLELKCLKSHLNLGDPAATSTISLAEIFHLCTKYSASQHDKLPSGVCNKCKTAAHAAYSFKLQTEFAYCRLKEIYDDSWKSEEITGGELSGER